VPDRVLPVVHAQVLVFNQPLLDQSEDTIVEEKSGRREGQPANYSVGAIINVAPLCLADARRLRVRDNWQKRDPPRCFFLPRFMNSSWPAPSQCHGCAVGTEFTRYLRPLAFWRIYSRQIIAITWKSVWIFITSSATYTESR